MTKQHGPLFSDFGVDPLICSALEHAGITHAFPIQAQTLPLALAGNDIIGQAKTGTGKTLGFGIPVLQRVTEPDGTPQALIVVPTRELCIQVASDLELAGKGKGVRVLAVYGGRAYEPQVEALRKGIDVVVGTPGRLIDLMKQKYLVLGKVRTLVLDEADEMLDMGFLPDVETLVNATSTARQTMLFSATMPGAIISLARRYMSNPTHIRAVDPDDSGSTVETVELHVWQAHKLDKQELVARVLQAEGRGLTIIFTHTKRAAQELADGLTERGFAAAAVHGDLGQGAREQALRAFRSGKVDVLVATDVAARGIDVEGVTHVINYECPDDDKTFLHRIGRTGRAGASGVAITLVDWADLTRWHLINKTLGLAFHDPIETYSSSDHVYTGLNIPRAAKGRLAKAQQTRAGLAAEELEDLGETGKRGGGGARRSDGRSDGRSGGRGERRNDGRGDARGGRGGRTDDAAGRGRGDRGPRRANAGDATPGESAGDDVASGSAAREPREPRERRRTRGGSNTDSARTETHDVVADSPASADGGAAPREPRGRRRTRGGASGAQSGTETIAD